MWDKVTEEHIEANKGWCKCSACFWRNYHERMHDMYEQDRDDDFDDDWPGLDDPPAPCLICGEPGCNGECWDDPENRDWKEMEGQKDDEAIEKYYEEKYGK